MTNEQDSVEELRHVITNHLQYYSDKERNERIDYRQKLPKETPNFQNDNTFQENVNIYDKDPASIQEYSKSNILDDVSNNDYKNQQYMQKDPPISNQSKLVRKKLFFNNLKGYDTNSCVFLIVFIQRFSINLLRTGKIWPKPNPILLL